MKKQSQSQSSIWDNLINIMPEFADKIKKSPNFVDPLAAESLYDIWRTAEKKEDKKFKKVAENPFDAIWSQEPYNK